MNGDVHGITVARSNSLRQYSPPTYHRNNFLPSDPPVPEYDRGSPARPPSGYHGPPPGYTPAGEYPTQPQHPPPYHDYSSLPRNNTRREDLRDPRDAWNNQWNVQDQHDPRFGSGPSPMREPPSPQDVMDPRDTSHPSPGVRDPRDPSGPPAGVKGMNTLPRSSNDPQWDPHMVRDYNGTMMHMRDPRDPRNMQDPRETNRVAMPSGENRGSRDLNGIPQHMREPQDMRNMGYNPPPGSYNYRGVAPDKQDYRDYRDSREYGRPQNMPDKSAWPNGTLPRDGTDMPRDSGTLPRDSGTLPRDSSTLPRDNRGHQMDTRNNNVMPYSKSSTLPPRSPTGGHFSPYQQQQQQQQQQHQQQQQQQQQQQKPNGSNLQPNQYSSLPRHRDSERSQGRPEVPAKPQIAPAQHAQQYDRVSDLNHAACSMLTV